MVGQGLTACGLAALWPDPIAWDIPEDNNSSASSRPLLIHASNGWLWDVIDIPRHILTQLEVYDDKIGHIHTVYSHDCGMDFFGWIVDPQQLMRTLYHRALSRPRVLSEDVTCWFIATGRQLPDEVLYQEHPGLFFHVAIQPSSSCKDHTIMLTWSSQGKTTAGLPGVYHQGVEVVTECKKNADAQSYRSYYRTLMQEHYIAIGDSLMIVPPTLATGFNTLLQCIQRQRDNPMIWGDIKRYVEHKARRQHQRALRYHKFLGSAMWRGCMYAGLKNKQMMRFCIEDILYAY